MEEDQEKTYSCKFCNKICFSGKSLGGHMRGHSALISAKKDLENEDCRMGFDGSDQPKGLIISEQSNSSLIPENIKNSDMGFEHGGQGSYGPRLRDKPKKSWRVLDSKHSVLKKGIHCEQCGNGFQSLRVLKVHMRCHLKKDNEENVCKECGRGFGTMRALFGHMRSHPKRSRVYNKSVQSQSGFESIACPIRRKRSKTRYRISPNPSFSDLNSSSLISGSEEEVEVAMCLMMLSRGVRNWGGFNLVTGSSDHNSVVLEAQSFHQSEEITAVEGGNFVLDGDESWKIPKLREKLDSPLLCSANPLTEKNISESADFESGIASIDENKIELEVSDDGLPLGDEYALELNDTDTEKGSNVGLEKHTVIEVMKSDSAKNPVIGVHDLELGGNSGGKMNFSTTDSEILRDTEKKQEYKCRTCNKVFHSHQALGGHRTHHRIINSSSVVDMESNGKSIRTSVLSDNEANSKPIEQETGMEVTSYESIKSKDHECPICFKVFSSGQALGGHKRAHYNIAFSESRAKETVVIEQELPDIHNIFDLNLSGTQEEGDDSDIVFKSWWVGRDHEHKAMVISN
ncbi:unnamed protein product [Ilex paraguariensis]|uniref:C2H2-type domain-containing protein n=1 Tax=Ilex paraguariensis TaxID=185542 RepID=A0ABC8UY60_9AQUA